MKIIRRVSVVLTALFAAQMAHAVPIEVGPVSDNAFITQGGLDWAWANPLPGTAPSFEISAEQAGLGWRLPTLDELLAAPDALDFLFAGGNVPFAGVDPVTGATFNATNADYTNAASDGACASAWFSNTFVHCDWQDGQGQPLDPWAGLPGAETFADQLVVRVATAVPEPATLALLGLGLLGTGLARRWKKI